MNHLEKAIEVAARQLSDKTDKANKPLILHALRVMFKMDTAEEMIVAVLHDVPEESGLLVSMILDSIYLEWYSNAQAKRIEDALKRLTHQKGVTYADYISIVSVNPLATKVKIADLLDNLDPKRLALLEEDVQDFLNKRYGKALNTLGYRVNEH